MGATRRYLPPEHGAWAMLLVPFLLGTFSADPDGWSAVLLVAWLSAYLTSYYGVRWWRARGRADGGTRFRRPSLLYGALLLAAGTTAVLVEPWLLLAGLLFVPPEAVAVRYAVRGDARSWVAGTASATAAALMAPVAYRFAGGTDDWLAAALLTISWLALVGSVLHVKSTIRERSDPRWRRASVAFHVVALGVASALDPWLALPFGFLLVRAVAVPRQGWRPARIGAVEVVGSALVLVVPLVPAAPLTG